MCLSTIRDKAYDHGCTSRCFSLAEKMFPFSNLNPIPKPKETKIREDNFLDANNKGRVQKK